MCGSSTSSHKVLGKRLNSHQGKNPRKKIGITTTVAKCTHCGLIYSNPQPIPNKIQDHYGVSPETYWHLDYFKIDPQYFKNEISILKSLYQFEEGNKALDIGAGIGKAMVALSNAGFDSFGIEPSAEFRAKAIEEIGINPDKLTLNSIEDASFPDGYFDFITFGAVLEHLQDPSVSISKALMWLKSGGIMQIEVPSSDWLIAKIVNAYYQLKGLDYVTNISPMHEPYHLYEFTLRSFIEKASKQEYEIVKYDYYVANTFMPKTFDFFLVPYMRWMKSGMQLCVWLKKK